MNTLCKDLQTLIFNYEKSIILKPHPIVEILPIKYDVIKKWIIENNKRNFNRTFLEKGWVGMWRFGLFTTILEEDSKIGEEYNTVRKINLDIYWEIP